MTRPTLPLPAFGAPCNGCGECCHAELCAASLTVQKLPVSAGAQTCKFIDWQGDGTARCGLLTRTEENAPELVAQYGAPRVRRAIEYLLAVGVGCTSQQDRATDAQKEAFDRACARIVNLAQGADTLRIFPIAVEYHEL